MCLYTARKKIKETVLTKQNKQYMHQYLELTVPIYIVLLIGIGIGIGIGVFN